MAWEREGTSSFCDHAFDHVHSPTAEEQWANVPTQAIAREAEQTGCDLIVMSTHGHGSFLDLLCGSVAHGVRHTADIPVLLVRGKRGG